MIPPMLGVKKFVFGLVSNPFPGADEWSSPDVHSLFSLLDQGVILTNGCRRRGRSKNDYAHEHRAQRGALR